MKWTPEIMKKIKALKRDGYTYEQIGRLYGESRQTIAGAVRRHIYGIGDYHIRKTKGVGRDSVTSWDESQLTESWKDYHARKQKERRCLVK